MGPSSYVILGLVRDFGPCTPYDLKQIIATSIGYFWDFPQSQLYAEANRLVGLGLLEELDAPSGRRRRVLALTDEGRAALVAWLHAATPAQSEIRDLGLLKLFFTVERRDLVRLAKDQLA